MDEKKITRINELAAKSRTSKGLTESELKEQAELRREYIDSYKRSLTAQLDNTYYIDKNGKKKKVERKKPN